MQNATWAEVAKQKIVNKLDVERKALDKDDSTHVRKKKWASSLESQAPPIETASRLSKGRHDEGQLAFYDGRW